MPKYPITMKYMDSDGTPKKPKLMYGKSQTVGPDAVYAVDEFNEIYPKGYKDPDDGNRYVVAGDATLYEGENGNRWVIPLTVKMGGGKRRTRRARKSKKSRRGKRTRRH